MYKPMRLGAKGFFVAIIILAAIFIIIYGNYVYGATQVDEPDEEFRSEEDLIDETRQEIEKHLHEVKELSAEIKQIFAKKPPAPEMPEIIEEEQQEEVAVQVNQEAPQEEDQAQPEEKQIQSEEEQPAAEEKPVVEEQTQSKAQDGPFITLAKAAEEEPVAKEEAQPISVVLDAEGNPQPQGEEIDFSAKKKGIYLEPALEQPSLKKMDISKIGASPYYETYEGLRLLKYFTVGQRVEIYQEPRPIDSYILDAHAMRYLYNNTPWNIKSDYRTQLTPIFTRAYGTEFTISDPKNKEGQIRYTHDYRDIYRNYWPKYSYNDQAFLKHEMWDQNELLLMHSKIIEPIDWLYTSNLGYRYSTMSAKSDHAYYEVRTTYFGSLSVAPTDKIEYFFQGEYYKSRHLKAGYSYSPDHFLGRGEIRIKSSDFKTVYVPQLSYSKDLYYPFANSYEKYEIAFRVGRDFTNRFSASSTLQYVYSFRDEPDNTAPTYARKNPIKDKAEYISLQNRFSYNVYDRLYLQAGLDIANGINWSIFDNWGILGGIEYYAPGIIRVDVGYRGNHYYNLQDWLSSIYFKFYLFM